MSASGLTQIVGCLVGQGRGTFVGFGVKTAGVALVGLATGCCEGSEDGGGNVGLGAVGDAEVG